MGQALFSKEFLRDMGGKTIREEIIDRSRWTVTYERIFEHEGRFYLTYYSVGSTEIQDESPYEYDPDMISCTEVKPVEKVVTVYEPV